MNDSIDAGGIDPSLSPLVLADRPSIVHQHFNVADHGRSMQAGVWCDQVGRILDTSVSRVLRERGFRGELDTYVLNDMIYLDSRTDPLVQSRSVARISRDDVRDYVFHIAVEGVMETTTGGLHRKSSQFSPGILVLDMNQPMRMERPTPARVLAFFLPRPMVEAVIPDAEALHGQVMAYTSPLSRLVREHLAVLCQNSLGLPVPDLEQKLRDCAYLILAALARQSHLGDRALAAVRSAMRARILAYIQSNLHEEGLSPASILRQFPLPRPTLYRMFEAEGGLATYIRHCRLQAAAAQLSNVAMTPVTDIAYRFGFGSSSDFARAFRRLYGMSPQDYRALELDMYHW